MVVFVVGVGILVLLMVMIGSVAMFLTALTAVLYSLRVEPVGTVIGLVLFVLTVYVFEVLLDMAPSVVVTAMVLAYLGGIVVGATVQQERYQIDRLQRPIYRSIVVGSAVALVGTAGLLIVLVLGMVGGLSSEDLPSAGPLLLLLGVMWSVGIFVLSVEFVDALPGGG